MSYRAPGSILKWLAAFALAGNLAALAYLGHRAAQTEKAAEAAGDRAAPKKGGENPGEVTLNASLAESLLLEVEAVRSEPTWFEPVTVYGQVVPNPLATAEVRAPFAGTLREGNGGWPRPGQWIKAGEVLGRVDVRVAPQERLDLRNRLNEAVQKHKGAAEALKVKQAVVDRLAAAPNSLSFRELEEARLQLNEARTQEAAARAAVQLWEQAVADIDRPGPQADTPWSLPLKAPAAGEVTELAGHSGTAVEAGAVVLRLVDFRRPLVRLDLPPEVLRRGAPLTLDVFAAAPTPPALYGARNQPQSSAPPVKLRAHVLGGAPGVNPASQFAGYLYAVEHAAGPENGDSVGSRSAGEVTDGLAWRPGLALRAEVPVPPGPEARGREAVSVPESALLYHQGRPLVYWVKSREGKKICYARCEVQLLGRKDGRWILAAGPVLDDKVSVVVRNAQVLLSEEFKTGTDDED